MNKSQKDWTLVINYAGNNLIPIHCISTSWNYFLAMTQPFSNANLIQAQRDFLVFKALFLLIKRKTL